MCITCEANKGNQISLKGDEILDLTTGMITDKTGKTSPAPELTELMINVLSWEVIECAQTWADKNTAV